MKKIDIALIIYRKAKEFSNNNIDLYHQILEDIKKSMTKKELKDFDDERKLFLTDDLLLKIKKIIESYLEIETISTKNRKDPIPYGKQLFCYFVLRQRNKEKSRNKYPLIKIGNMINVDHSSVTLANQKLLRLLDVDKNVKHDISEIEKLINILF